MIDLATLFRLTGSIPYWETGDAGPHKWHQFTDDQLLGIAYRLEIPYVGPETPRVNLVRCIEAAERGRP
jgi:hypothetical protein